MSARETSSLPLERRAEFGGGPPSIRQVQSESISARKRALVDLADRLAPARRDWRHKAAFFHQEDERYLRFLIPKGLSILELGCGSGDTLASLDPRFGVGIDMSARMVAEARDKHPHLIFHVGDAEDEDILDGIAGTFDVILIVDTMGVFDDCQAALEKLHRFCRRETRIIISYYSHLWQPFLKFAEIIGLRSPQTTQSVLSVADIGNFAHLAGYDRIKSVPRLLCPFRLLGLGRFINRFLSPLPGLRQLSFRHYTVCRSLRSCENDIDTATIVIPARNERGNIEAAIERLPTFCTDVEVIFIEGHSKDGTFEEI